MLTELQFQPLWESLSHFRERSAYCQWGWTSPASLMPLLGGRRRAKPAKIIDGYVPQRATSALSGRLLFGGPQSPFCCDLSIPPTLGAPRCILGHGNCHAGLGRQDTERPRKVVARIHMRSGYTCFSHWYGRWAT